MSAYAAEAGIFLSCHEVVPCRLQDKERGIASDYLTPGYVVKDRVVAVVGTGEERAQKAGGGWTPCKGRLLLIQIQANQTGMPCTPMFCSLVMQRCMHG